jgi:parallel beta-helix repeat protein
MQCYCHSDIFEILSDELKEDSDFFVSALRGGEKLRERKLKKRILATVFCTLFCLAAVSLFVIPVHSTSQLSEYISYEPETNTFIVYPTNGDDTVNIQAVFDAAKDTGPGTTVLLTEGIFTITGPILAINFDGHFTGVGKDITIVQTNPNIPFALPEPPFHNCPFMFTFMQDNDEHPTIKISDMTLFTRGESTPWGAHGTLGLKYLNAIRIFGKWTGTDDSEQAFVNTIIERVHLEGEEVDWNRLGTNLLNGISVWGEDYFIVEDGSTLYGGARQQVGNHKVTDCSFQNIVYAMGYMYQWNSNLVVEDNKYNDVRVAIYVSDQSNSDIRITRNELTNIHWYGIWVEQSFLSVVGLDLGPYGDIPDTSRLLIDGNSIHCISTADGIAIYDYSFEIGESCRLSTVITNNKIVLEGTNYGGIYGYGASDVIVSNNKISGYGGVGIYFYYASGWMIQGNNLQTLDPWFISIYLGSGTYGCTVIGGSTKTIVYDVGIDNLIVGVNNMEGNSLGQELADALDQKKEVISQFR